MWHCVSSGHACPETGWPTVAKLPEAVASALRQALSRDKTRTQVFDISELGLVEMTRKRVNEGLLESVSKICTVCDGRGFVVETGL